MDTPIRVGLVGYGKAGEAVAKVLSSAKDVDLVWIAKNTAATASQSGSAPAPIVSASELGSERMLDHYPVDAIIDFSHESAIDLYGIAAANRHVCVITAISRYSTERKSLIKRISKSTAIMSSPNMTLGINFLLVAAQLLQHIAPFTDIEVIEEHFRDKPERSGTALRIANQLGLDESKVNSIRVGGIVGHHEVVFGFPYQTVRLVHDSISREAFGTGALFALRNIIDREPGLYVYDDLLREAMTDVLLGQQSHIATPLSSKFRAGHS